LQVLALELIDRDNMLSREIALDRLRLVEFQKAARLAQIVRLIVGFCGRLGGHQGHPLNKKATLMGGLFNKRNNRFDY
jgi:hypothetical protein